MNELPKIEPPLDAATPETSVPKKSIFRSKKTIIIATVLILLLLGGGFYVYQRVVQSRQDQKSQPSSNQSIDGLSDTDNSLNELYINISDITLQSPTGWARLSESTNFTSGPILKLQSPEVTSGSLFQPIDDGIEITLDYSERDSQAESGFEDPLDAYVRSVGSPRINDEKVDFYERAIDWTKYYRFTNSNGIDMVSYPWTYEGCKLLVLFLNESKVYTITIRQKECPGTDLLTNDPSLKAFINSVKLQPGDNRFDLDISIKHDSAKPSNVTVVAKNVSFTYGNPFKANNLQPLSTGDGILVPKLDNQGNLISLQIGQTTESFRAQWQQCGSNCGFLAQAYGASITYSPDQLNTSGLTQITDYIYGSTELITPLQQGSTSYTYKYHKSAGNGSFVISFTVEIIESEQNPFIKLADEHLIDTIQSVQLAY